FFFSSRRRHTSFSRDWSSDVCSSDLPELLRVVRVAVGLGIEEVRLTGGEPLLRPDLVDVVAGIAELGVEVSMTTNALGLDKKARSEERRVGKECRSRRSPHHDETKTD